MQMLTENQYQILFKSKGFWYKKKEKKKLLRKISNYCAVMNSWLPLNHIYPLKPFHRNPSAFQMKAL